jgi:hypothetical protein
MADVLITQHVWKYISKTTKEHRGKSQVAVAYFGTTGAKMLPLKKGSSLLVDASEKAVKSGQTNPSELLKLYKKGVFIYSQTNLHAKVYVFGNKSIIGSANVSDNSANHLQEVVMVSSQQKLAAESRKFILSNCILELGDAELKRLKQLYKPPRIENKAKSKASPKNNDTQKRLSVIKLEEVRISDEHYKESQQGKVRAKRLIKDFKRHRIDDFIVGKKLNYRIGDLIITNFKNGNRNLVSPVGRIIQIDKSKVSSSKQWNIYIELPKAEDIYLSKLKKEIGADLSRIISRHGFKSNKHIANIINTFKAVYGTK